MKSIILCEGKTDVVFLEYYMIKVNSWSDYRKADYRYQGNFSRMFRKEEDYLTIASVGGCTNFEEAVKDVLAYEKHSSPGNEFGRIILITDNDDDDSIGNREAAITRAFVDSGIDLGKEIKNMEWTDFEWAGFDNTYKNTARFCLVTVPFDENGAIETFLLKTISEADSYDAEIVKKGKEYVSSADPEERYLKHRRDKIKAEYEVFFDIRTTEDQFVDRRNILKNIPWENYEKIRSDFAVLNTL